MAIGSLVVSIIVRDVVVIDVIFAANTHFPRNMVSLAKNAHSMLSEPIIVNKLGLMSVKNGAFKGKPELRYRTCLFAHMCRDLVVK